MHRTPAFKKAAKREYRRILKDFRKGVDKTLAAQGLPPYYPIPISKKSGLPSQVSTSEMEIPADEEGLFSVIGVPAMEEIILPDMEENVDDELACPEGNKADFSMIYATAIKSEIETDPIQCVENTQDEEGTIQTSYLVHEVKKEPCSITESGQESTVDYQAIITDQDHESSGFEVDSDANITQQARFKCDECPKTYAQNFSLTRHKRVHTGVTPYQCEQCSRKFARRSHLMSHTRVHTGRKSFQCDECAKLFADKFSLIKHRRNHRGEQQFQCEKNLSSETLGNILSAIQENNRVLLNVQTELKSVHERVCALEAAQEIPLKKVEEQIKNANNIFAREQGKIKTFMEIIAKNVDIPDPPDQLFAQTNATAKLFPVITLAAFKTVEENLQDAEFRNRVLQYVIKLRDAKSENLDNFFSNTVMVTLKGTENLFKLIAEFWFKGCNVEAKKQLDLKILASRKRLRQQRLYCQKKRAQQQLSILLNATADNSQMTNARNITKLPRECITSKPGCMDPAAARKII